ncbi:hypothetical protein N0V82_005401 [Gnomoniopsis sp. IMI 355080]|nr:hypothetical protein N0V82_005401 [Gnomoniopsis sp. IMI 355080]
MEVSGPMDLLPRGNMESKIHPETLMRSNTTSNKPRALPAGVPGLPHPKQRGLPPQPTSTVSSKSPEPAPIKTNPWKLTREFDEILGTYQEPELVPRVPATQQNHQPQQQGSNWNHEPGQQLQIEEGDISYAMAQNQRGTLNIAYDPNWQGQQQQQSQNQMPSNPPPNRFDLGYVDKKPQAFVSQQEVGAGSPEDRPYQPDWITAETKDITDRSYYDTDANNESYTHQAVAVRVAAPTMINYSGSADDEFERPRQVPAFNPRSTRIILKEDIDFLKAVRDGTEPPPLPGSLPSLPEAEQYRRSSQDSAHSDVFVRQQDVDFYMALLAGSEPPTASPETDALVQEEEEMRRRSEAAAAEEAERRRLEELQTNQNDLDFLAALLQ